MTKTDVKMPPEDDEIERHDAYIRLNPLGHKELVVTAKGREEETLNELSNQLNGLLEGIDFGSSSAVSAEQPIQDRTPQLVASTHDPMRVNGDTITNMTGSTPRTADLDISLARAPLGATIYGDDKQEYTGDGLDNGAVHSEGFTGTGAIAIGPGPYEIIGKKDKNSNRKSPVKKLLEAIDDLNMLLELD